MYLNVIEKDFKVISLINKLIRRDLIILLINLREYLLKFIISLSSNKPDLFIILKH